MKPVLLLSALAISLFSTAQKVYIPDEHISIEGEPGKQKIVDYYQERVLCGKIPADDIVTAPLNGLMGFRKGSKYGLMNIYGKIIVPAAFDAYEEGEGTYPIEFRGDYFAVRKGETKGLIDSTGKFAVPLGNYDYIWYAKAGFAAAEREGLFGLFRNGKTFLPMEYDADHVYYTDRFEFNRETEVIVKASFYGLINQKGAFVQDTKYIGIDFFGEKYWILIGQDEKAQLADSSGKILLNKSFTQITKVTPNYIFAVEGTKHGMVRFDGSIACPFEFDALGTEIFSDAVFVKQGYKWGVFHLDNPEPVSFDFDNEFSPKWTKNGLATIRINGLWGLTDSQGKIVHEAVFENDSDPVFYNGFASVTRNEKVGILSSTGKLILPCEYERVEPQISYNQIVKKGHKLGLLSENFEILIPCEYDELEDMRKDLYLVKQGGKSGVYQLRKGLIVPTEFDEIMLFTDYGDNENYFETVVNKKIGFRELSGKPILPNIAEKIFRADSSGILISANGQLKSYSLKTGKELAFLPDSVKKFENTSFVYTHSRWYCISNADNRIIGREYSILGQFDGSGRVIAYPSEFDYAIGLNSKGEELNPGFHLVKEPVFDTIIETNEPSLITSILAQKHLIEDQLVIQLSPFDLFDELGYETGETRCALSCYYKKNYFGEDHFFPAEPIYEFNFSDHYANWGTPNAAGWRWANVKDFYSEDRLPYLSRHTVLVHESGKEIRKDNYIPVNSLPFFEYTFNQQYEPGASIPTIEMPESLPWDSLWKFPQVIDSLKMHFPAATGLTSQQFLLQYKDSIYTHEYTNWMYVEEVEEIRTFTYSFYQISNAQLFELPPPINVKYRFVLEEPKKLKGGENLRDYRDEAVQLMEKGIYTVYSDIPFVQALPMGEKTAFVFGDLGYFVYPKFDQYATESKRKEIIREYLNDPEYRIVAPLMQHIEQNEKLLEIGFAKPADSYFKQDSVYNFLATHTGNLQLYMYPKNVGLALENELLLQPNYFSIASDNSAFGKKGRSDFLVMDSTLQVWRYDLSTRKLTADQKTDLIGITKDGIITQNNKTRLYGFNNYGALLNSPFDESIEKTTFIPNMNDIQQLEFIGNCDFSMPIVNNLGEDSIIYHEDGTYEYLYYQYCDTNVMGKYGRFKNGLDLHAYKQLNQPAQFFFLHQPNETYTFSKTAITADFPFNHHADGDYIIEETSEGLRLVLGDRTLDIPEKEYFQVREIPKLSNGFGGIYRKGKYIPYQTLLAFPEKHDVNIHLKKSYYLVGEAGKLELVKLNSDQTLVKSGISFTSGQEMEERYSNDFDVRYQIQDFMGLDSW
jgi:hypothetical protein